MTSKKIGLPYPIHPCFEYATSVYPSQCPHHSSFCSRALQKVMPYFEEVFIREQAILQDRETWDSILSFLPDGVLFAVA
jgi:hypothetical protein